MLTGKYIQIKITKTAFFFLNYTLPLKSNRKLIVLVISLILRIQVLFLITLLLQFLYSLT